MEILKTPDGYHSGVPAASGFSTAFTPVTTAAGSEWDAQGVTYNVIGNVTYTLAGGVDYSAGNAMKAELGDLITAYSKFETKMRLKLITSSWVLGASAKVIRRQKQTI